MKKGTDNIKPGYNRGLTVKQMAFSHAVMSGCTDADAYVQSYLEGDRGDKKNAYISRKAVDVKKSKGVSDYLAELKEKARADSEITTQDLLDELEEARSMAMSRGSFGVAVQATMGKVKLLGKDKQVLELTGNDDKPVINITVKERKK